jgi:signal recognition particle subunit SEC65
MTPHPDDKELERHLAELGLRPKHAEKPTTTPQSKVYPKAETSDWYKQGKECPF